MDANVPCMLGLMRFPALFRQKQIWIPTISGWILTFALFSGLLLFAGRYVYPFLAPEQPAGARLLAVEGWLQPEELDQAVIRFKVGNYSRIITTGGPVSANLYHPAPVPYAVLARDYLVRRGLPAATVNAVPAPASLKDRTFLSAVMVRTWLEESGQTVAALDVFSSGVHSRRSRAVYRLAFGPDVRIGIIAARPTEYDPDNWWQTSAGAKTVIAETISWLWTELFFRPGPRGSYEEKWGLPPPARSAG